MTTEEAIKSFKFSNEQAKLRIKVDMMRMDIGEIKELKFYIERDEMAIKALEQKQKIGQFAKWVADEIFDENWEYNKDAFAELACRKLAKLGIVRAKGDEWELIESQESDE